MNELSMGAQFSSATLDDATMALIKRKTRMKSSEVASWFNELKARCPNGKMTKKEMLRCYKDLSTCDMEKVEHVVTAIHKAFDTDNDGKVGKCVLECSINVSNQQKYFLLFYIL